MLNVTYAPSRILIIFKTKKLRKKDCGSAVCTLSTAHDPDCYDCRCDKVSVYQSETLCLSSNACSSSDQITKKLSPSQTPTIVLTANIGSKALAPFHAGNISNNLHVGSLSRLSVRFSHARVAIYSRLIALPPFSLLNVV